MADNWHWSSPRIGIIFISVLTHVTLVTVSGLNMDNVYLETLQYYRLRIDIHGVRRLRHHPDGCLVSRLLCKPLNLVIPPNLFHTLPYGLVCGSRGCGALQYIGDGGVQRRKTLLIT